jgi:hypothetical protein
MASAQEGRKNAVNIGRFAIDRVEEFSMPGFAPQHLLPDLEEIRVPRTSLAEWAIGERCEIRKPDVVDS